MNRPVWSWCAPAALVFMVMVSIAQAAEPKCSDVVGEIQKWREMREKKLRADNGWLTLAGRFPLKPGANTFGTGKNNDVVFPSQLTGTGPERLGTLQVDAAAKKVVLQLADGVVMTSEGKSFSGDRVMGTVAGKRDWVSLGRISLHIIEREGRFILRLADNESLVRKNFPGCLWYAPDEKYKVEAKFTPYPEGKTLKIVNVIDEVSEEPCAGYVEFQLGGKSFKLDAIAEGEALFFVFKDATAGDTTYPPSRFLTIESRPKPNEPFFLDFNKAYNPPCAFSDFTTCPLPPSQNVLRIRIEAGEKFRKGE